MDIKRKTISPLSASVLKHFSDLSQPGFTFQEVSAFLKKSSIEAVKKLMRDMVKRGVLIRLKDGVYWIVPYEQDTQRYFPSPHLVAPYVVGDAGFYIGYYSALEVHSLITQPSFKEQIVVNRQIKPAIIKIKQQKFQFIYHNEKHFFGTTDIWVDSFNKARCSDLEKTFIDCLYKPDYAGGITEIAKGLYKSKGKIDFEKLLSYSKQFGAQSVIKRLGFLLELLEIDNPIIERLHSMKTQSYILLEPSYEKKGTLIPKWSISQNLETNDITSPIYS
jgi:predicted transcriptional regulator of viral defense system